MQPFVDLEGKIPAKDGDRVALVKTGTPDEIGRVSRAHHTALAQRNDIEQALKLLDDGHIADAKATLELALSLSAWMQSD